MITKEDAERMLGAGEHEGEYLLNFDHGIDALRTIIAQADEIAKLTAELAAERAKVKAWEEAHNERLNALKPLDADDPAQIVQKIAQRSALLTLRNRAAALAAKEQGNGR